MDTENTNMAREGAAELMDLRQQVADLQAILYEAQKMTALGELVSTTTHEFNNVLMTILNYAKIGARHKDGPTRDKAFDKILTAARRAEKITNSVLGIARNRKNEFMPTDFAKILDETLVLLERELNKYRISVETNIAKTPKILANGNQIQQVILNLLTNARQAMPKGGRVVLSLVYNPDENMVDFTIRDTGDGIPQEKLPRIFDRFFSTKSGPDASGKGGTGVGLSMCRDIIEAHHGKIRVQSKVGHGTAFTLRLPVAHEAESKPPTPIVALGVPTAVTSASAEGG